MNCQFALDIFQQPSSVTFCFQMTRAALCIWNLFLSNRKTITWLSAATESACPPQPRPEALAAAGCSEEATRVLQDALQDAQAAQERFLLWRLHASLGRLLCTMDRQALDKRNHFSCFRLVAPPA
jgi:hypothetical protein